MPSLADWIFQHCDGLAHAIDHCLNVGGHPLARVLRVQIGRMDIAR
ncbi:hypothetical protein [Burkholderia sp. BCC0322]|nr:hypothetical protein [Burkholderia sp. BCC0322]